MSDGEIILCETNAAIVLHARRLSKEGPRYSGGIDTPLLCGTHYINGWDTTIPISALALRPKMEYGVCGRCHAKVFGEIPVYLSRGVQADSAQRFALDRAAQMASWPEGTRSAFDEGHFMLMTPDGRITRLHFEEVDGVVGVIVPQRDEKPTLVGSGDDQLVWYGVCGYWTEDWSKLDTSNQKVPLCPGCRAPGFQISMRDWNQGVENQAALRPEYRAEVDARHNVCPKRPKAK